MAQFRATIQGQRGSASRLGSKRSGIDAAVHGWNAGVRIEARTRDYNDEDVFILYATNGSNGGARGDRYIGVIDGAGRFSLAHEHVYAGQCSVCGRYGGDCVGMGVRA